MYSNEVFEKWFSPRNDALEPFMTLNRLAAETVESLARRSYAIAGDYVDFGLSQLKAVTAGADVGQLVKEESRLAADLGEKLKAHAEAYGRIVADTREAFSAWSAALVETAATARPEAKTHTSKARKAG